MPLGNARMDEIAWAAGLFEGEGSFSMSGWRRRQAYVRLGMCDEDVVRRFHRVVGYGTVRGPFIPNKRAKKPHYLWCAGTFEQVQAVIAAFWPWLGERRRSRAVSILQSRALARVNREKPGPKSHLSGDDIRNIRSRYAAGDVTQKKLADQHGVSIGLINGIVHLRNHKEILSCR